MWNVAIYARVFSGSVWCKISAPSFLMKAKDGVHFHASPGISSCLMFTVHSHVSLTVWLFQPQFQHFAITYSILIIYIFITIFLHSSTDAKQARAAAGQDTGLRAGHTHYTGEWRREDEKRDSRYWISRKPEANFHAFKLKVENRGTPTLVLEVLAIILLFLQ